MSVTTTFPDIFTLTSDFHPSVFKKDVTSLCSSLKAPYSETILDKVLTAYEPNFHRGAVLWKATSRPEDGIAFRFYERKKVDVVEPAIKANLLAPNHPMIPLIKSWANISPRAISSCDFDPATGLSKTWVWLGGRLSLEALLAAAHVPEPIRALEQKFKAVGLDTVRHAAVDWRTLTINIYFWVKGQINSELANDLLSLSRGGPLTRSELEEIKSFLVPEGFTFATTIKAETGDIKRVAIYALRLDAKRLPKTGERLSTFFTDAKSHDQRDINIVAWSFGGGDKGTADYIKGERSYSGELEDVLAGWGSPMKE